ncbi:hypothetical protein PhCBS80983_g00211 [Powellomyces hirtus]|uniref:F-box domain-containing protein n=1 Tax=Powellomyces hirtus TaxID=109895 RepID=A0A507EG75_9FUNG|nr:hypothetical protein PhCBS80983_g00211 [Powellomyces hirtus]
MTAQLPTPSPVSELPPEIFHLILSRIRDPSSPTQHQKTFAACALVSRRWAPFAQSALWEAPILPTKERAHAFLARHMAEMQHESSPHQLIRNLDLTAVRFAEPEDTAYLHRLASRGMKKLRGLKLFADPLDPRTLAFILHACKDVVDLKITGSSGGGQSRYFYHLPPVRNMDSGVLSSLRVRLSQLRTLDLGDLDLSRGDGATLAHIVTTSLGPPLRGFAMPIISTSNRVQPLRDDTIAGQLAKQCPNLQVLVARGRYVTDRSLGVLARCCARLSVVDLTNCPGITAKGVMTLLEGCPLLSEVQIRGTTANDNLVKCSIARAALVRMMAVRRRRGGRIFGP